MSLLTTKIELTATKHNILLDLFPPIEGSVIYFLQLDGTTVNFKKTDNRAGISTGWRMVVNDYTQSKKMRVATTESNFHRVIEKSSHIAIGSATVGSSATVYAIARGSIAPPTDTRPYYAVEIEKAAGQSWVVT